MNVTNYDYALWAVGILLEVVVCLLALRNGLMKRYPTLVALMLLMVVAEFVRVGAYLRGGGYFSNSYFGAHWASHAALVMVRVAVVTEICLKTLQSYEGVWKLTKGLLGLAAGVLLGIAAINAATEQRVFVRFLLMVDAGIEFILLGTLLAFLMICRYYDVQLDYLTQQMIRGLGVYAGVQVVNNLFFSALGSASYQVWWNYVRIFSFFISFLVWAWALRRPVPEALPTPSLLEADVYNELAPQVNVKLRRLNDRLLELMKT